MMTFLVGGGVRASEGAASRVGEALPVHSTPGMLLGSSLCPNLFAEPSAWSPKFALFGRKCRLNKRRNVFNATRVVGVARTFAGKKQGTVFTAAKRTDPGSATTFSFLRLIGTLG
jgi:hypothetical protein